MIIRKAQIDDAESIRNVILSAGETGREEDFDDQGWSKFITATRLEPVRSRLQNNEYLTLCYIEDGRIEGIIAIKKFEIIDQLFVLPKKRRHGVATQLWESAKKACIINGNTGLFRVKSSTLAVPVYESFGFYPTGNRNSQGGDRLSPWS